MRGFGKCCAYLAAIGIFSFFLGRILPKEWFRYDRFPYRPFSFERSGNLYAALGIRRWKSKLPDMSRIFRRWMPPKTLPCTLAPVQLHRMLQETCVAEFTHTLLCAAGFGCVFLWTGSGGWSMAVLFLLGNLPFNLIQRHNRPKLARIFQKTQVRSKYPEPHKEDRHIIHD